MSFRRQVLAKIRFDERFRFGGEDLDFCLLVRRNLPGSRLLLTPHARVKHHFKPSLRDTLRRSRSYGRGCARLYRKWPTMRPTIFPGPVGVIALLVASAFIPALAVVALFVPLLMYPKGVRLAVTRRQPECVLDAYVQLAQESYGNIGYLGGLWRYRTLKPEPVVHSETEKSSSDVPAELSA
jgi:hypothetical protein